MPTGQPLIALYLLCYLFTRESSGNSRVGTVLLKLILSGKQGEQSSVRQTSWRLEGRSLPGTVVGASGGLARACAGRMKASRGSLFPRELVPPGNPSQDFLQLSMNTFLTGSVRTNGGNEQFSRQRSEQRVCVGLGATSRAAGFYTPSPFHLLGGFLQCRMKISITQKTSNLT